MSLCQVSDPAGRLSLSKEQCGRKKCEGKKGLLAHSVDKHTARGTRLNSTQIAADILRRRVRFISSTAG